jgi:imidazolonepropionase-like amidohydrolase
VSVYLTNARVVDASGAREAASVLIEASGRIGRVGAASDAVPEGATVVDLEGRTLLPGLIDAHVHVTSFDLPSPMKGEAAIAPEVKHHFVAAGLREMLRMGITTLRDVGAFGDDLLHARRAMEFGAFEGPRVLACGRIVSATSPGGAHFAEMYREADGPDEMRKATREQIRRGADFVKLMTTGARSVVLEDPEPAQVTRAEVATVVEEAHRMGFRVAAHCEGLDGTRLAIEEGVDTIEHGLELYRAPELLAALADSGRILVPTLSCFFDISETHACLWAPRLVELAKRQREEAHRTVEAARAAGVRMAMGFDSMPHGQSALELVRMHDAGLTPLEAIGAATAVAADACGLGDEVGTVQAGKLADLVVVDGDPLADPRVLLDRERIWLVLQSGRSVAGAALEPSSGFDPGSGLQRTRPGV